jgi:GxxExxY protein
MKQDLVFPELSYEISGLLFEVHNELGRYCGEKQYGDLLENKLQKNKILYERERVLPASFEGEQSRNRVDFLIEDKIIIELKCKRINERNDFYQLKRYLIALRKRLGLLVNFRERYLKPKRVLNPNCKD